MRVMESPNPPNTLGLTISWVCAFFAWISWQNSQAILTVVSVSAAIIASTFVANNARLQAKKAKKEIELLNMQLKEKQAKQPPQNE
jgi:hypothetical protein